MLILALETSTELGSCALWRDGVVTERFCPEKQPHSETLLPLVRELLGGNGVRIADLDAIAFGVGPGAFTGLRVACGAAQGLAVAADLPLVAVTSLETMAAQSSAERVLALARNHRRRQAIRRALDSVRGSDLMDPATGLFTRDLFGVD